MSGHGQTRVLQVLQPEDGGVAQHVLLLSTRLKQRGWRVEVAASPTNTILPALADAGIRTHELTLARAIGRGDAWALRELRRIDREGGFDVVHAHSAKAGGLVRAGLPNPRRLAYTPHCFPFIAEFGRRQQTLYRAIEQALVPRCGAITAVSEWERSLGLRALRGADSRMRVIRNGVPTYEQVELDRELLEFKGDRPLVGLVSVLRPEKDPLTAVRAAAVLARRGALRSRLAIVGNGELGSDVEAEISRLGLCDSVRRFPFEPPVNRYLRALDVFALPSLWEALPLGPMEAMNCELPVVATSVGGVPEIVEDGVTGTLVEPRSPDALAAGIEYLLANPDVRRRMGRAGRAAAQRRFGVERMVDEIEAVYRQLIAEGPAIAAPWRPRRHRPAPRPADAGAQVD